MKKYPCIVENLQSCQDQFQPHHNKIKKKKCMGELDQKIPSTNKTAFQYYTSEMMKALNNPWNPRGRKTTTPVGAKIAPLVYLSLSGTSEEDQSTKRKANEEIVGISMPALDKTELVPENLSQVKNPASPVKFTKKSNEWSSSKGRTKTD